MSEVKRSEERVSGKEESRKREDERVFVGFHPQLPSPKLFNLLK
jgi:hypothetical protein